MVGRLAGLLSGCALAAAMVSNSPAQFASDTQVPTSQLPSKRPGWFGSGPDARHPGGGRPESERFENVRKSIDALTPEQRKRFKENLQRWSNLSPEEKKALADRDAFRRKKIAEDIDAAIKEAGLDLDAQGREHFAKRYGEERHQIEEQLRRDMDEKRRPLLKEVIARLKVEFANGVPTADKEPKQPDTPPPAAPGKP